MFLKITVDSFKLYFTRDFPYGIDSSKHILDSDIQRAIDESFLELNHGLSNTQDHFDTLSNYLSAHYLVTNLRSSGQGLSGEFEWTTASKSASSVSLGLAIPQDILNSPTYSFLSKTNYGARYLKMVWPLLAGQIFISKGATQA